MIRRISIFGGPGCGKSTLASKLFAILKEKKYQIEQAKEWVKTWAILGVKQESYDTFFIMANQLHEEDVLLRKAKLLITDSPILLQAAYSSYYGFKGVDHLIAVAKMYDREYPSLNLNIQRTVEYEQFGRYQNPKQALEFDDHLQNFLANHLEGYLININVNETDKIVGVIEGALNVS